MIGTRAFFVFQIYDRYLMNYSLVEGTWMKGKERIVCTVVLGIRN